MSEKKAKDIISIAQKDKEMENIKNGQNIGEINRKSQTHTCMYVYVCVYTYIYLVEIFG